MMSSDILEVEDSAFSVYSQPSNKHISVTHFKSHVPQWLPISLKVKPVSCLLDPVVCTSFISDIILLLFPLLIPFQIHWLCAFPQKPQVYAHLCILSLGTPLNPDIHVAPFLHLLKIFAQMLPFRRVCPWTHCKFSITLLKLQIFS